MPTLAAGPSEIVVASQGETRWRDLRHEGDPTDRDQAITYALTRIDKLPLLPPTPEQDTEAG